MSQRIQLKTITIPFRSITLGNRYRKAYNNIDELAESIQKRGLLHPLVVNEAYHLCAGGRRYLAIETLGWDTVSVTVVNGLDETKIREIELIENIMRDDPTWQEDIAALVSIRELHSANGMSMTDTAKALHISKGHLSMKLKVANGMVKAPELAKAKTWTEAYKQYDLLLQKVMVSELANRTQRKAEQRAKANAEAMALVNKSKELLNSPHEPQEEALDKLTMCYHIADTLEELKKLPTGVMADVQFIDCDPDYGVSIVNTYNHITNAASYKEVDLSTYTEWITELIKELYRVTGPNVTMALWFAFKWYGVITKALQEAKWKFDSVPCVWYKKTAGPTAQPFNLLGRSYEPFLLCHKNEILLGKPGRYNVFECPTILSNRIHLTEKPVPLLKEIIETTTIINPSMKVFSAFLGSGNIILAAQELGLEVFGYDISEEHKQKFIARAKGVL